MKRIRQYKNKKKIALSITSRSLLLLVLLGLLPSCIKDKLLDYLDLFPMTLYASADYNHRGKDATIPSTYIMQSEYNTYALPTDTSCPIEIMTRRGTQVLYAYNAADSVSMNANLMEAWVQRVSGDTIQHIPEYFFSTFEYISPQQAQPDSVHFQLEQQMRRLDIEIELGLPERQIITHGEGVLQGVYAMFNISTLEYSQDTFYVAFPLQLTQEALVSELHLFGFNPNISQQLTLTLFLEDGSQLTVEDDLSQELGSFNDDKLTPFHLGTQLNLKHEAGFTATLDDWIIEDEKEIIVQ